MARAISSGCSPRACTIQSAMRSAERGPTPGICRSCAIRSRIAAGYSVFLKAGQLSVDRRCFGQMQDERLEPAQIQLQRRVFLTVVARRILECGVGFVPAFLAIKNNAVPEIVAPRDRPRASHFRQRQKFVNFKPFARSRATEKINRPRDESLFGELKGARPKQNARTVKAIRDAKTSRQFHRLAHRHNFACDDCSANAPR